MAKIIQFKRGSTSVTTSKPAETYTEKQERMARERAESNVKVLKSYRIKR